MQIQELNVYIIVFNEEKILVLKRKDDLWEFPGGGVDWGENPQESAVRETEEETNLTISDLQLLGISSATYKKNKDDKHSVYIVYKAKSATKKVLISNEHAEYRWLLVNELKFLKLGINAERALELCQQ